MKWLLGLFIIASSVTAHAVKIEFPEEELAQESVYPVFDTPVAVKSKNVVTSKHFEASIFTGWTLNDAIVDPLNFGGTVTYHLNDIHAIELYATFFSASVSSYGEQLQAGAGFNLRSIDQVPKPSMAFMGSYQITPWYGKISLTKQTVWNMMIYGIGGVGLITFDNSDLINGTYNGGDSSILFDAGLGLKVYFTNKLSLITDLRYLFYQGPNPVHQGSGSPAPVVFKEHSVLNSIITIGVGYIL